MSKDGHANTVTKHRLWESLARHTKSEMKCLGQKNLSPCSSCMITVPLLLTSGNLQEAMLVAEPALRAELQISGYWKHSRGNGHLKWSWCRAKAEGNTLQPQDEHKGRQRGSTTPAVIKTLEKPLRCCCPFHRAPDLSPTFCRRQTALKIRPL